MDNWQVWLLQPWSASGQFCSKLYVLLLFNKHDLSFINDYHRKIFQPHWHLLCFLGSGGWWQDCWRTRTSCQKGIYQWGKWELESYSKGTPCQEGIYQWGKWMEFWELIQKGLLAKKAFINGVSENPFNWSLFENLFKRDPLPKRHSSMGQVRAHSTGPFFENQTLCQEGVYQLGE